MEMSRGLLWDEWSIAAVAAAPGRAMLSDLTPYSSIIATARAPKKPESVASSRSRASDSSTWRASVLNCRDTSRLTSAMADFAPEMRAAGRPPAVRTDTTWGCALVRRNEGGWKNLLAQGTVFRVPDHADAPADGRQRMHWPSLHPGSARRWASISRIAAPRCSLA